MVSYCLEVNLMVKELAMQCLALCPRRKNSRELYVSPVEVTILHSLFLRDGRHFLVYFQVPPDELG